MLAGSDSFRMPCGRHLLQLSISAHDPKPSLPPARQKVQNQAKYTARKRRRHIVETCFLTFAITIGEVLVFSVVFSRPSLRNCEIGAPAPLQTPIALFSGIW